MKQGEEQKPAGQGMKPRGSLKSTGNAEHKARVLAKAAANPHGVKVGQVWQDCDPRMSGRHCKVMAIEGAYAECASCSAWGEVFYYPTVKEGRAVRQGQKTIRLDRFKPCSTGYRLVIEAGQ